MQGREHQSQEHTHTPPLGVASGGEALHSSLLLHLGGGKGTAPGSRLRAVLGDQLVEVVAPGNQLVAVAPGNQLVAVVAPGNQPVAVAPGNQLVAVAPGNQLVAVAPGNQLMVVVLGNQLVAVVPGNQLVVVALGNLQERDRSLVAQIRPFQPQQHSSGQAAGVL